MPTGTYTKSLLEITTALCTASQSSAYFDTTAAESFSIQTEWTATTTGTFTIMERVSSPDITSAFSYQANTDITLDAALGSAGGQVYNVGNVQSNDYYLKFTYSAGAGRVRAVVLVKGDG